MSAPPVYRRRAVVVGINYTACGEIALRGCCNDAYAFALALVNLYHFDPRDVLLLTDDEADYEPKNDPKDAAARARQQPVRSNIIQGLKWLTGGVHPGDVLVFYFAGHGLQIDNLSGWEGEGFDEAILPLDCTHQQGDVNAISAVCLRSHFLSVSERVQLNVFLDCAGGQSALDVTGGSKWTFIKGVVQKGIWPLTDPTDKMRRARYDSRVWTAETMRAAGVRPRYVPGVEVNNTSELSDVQSRFKKGGGEKTHAYMIAGAPFSEVPVEALCPALKIRAVSAKGHLSKDCLTVRASHVYHGAFTWCLIQALHDCARNNAARRTTYVQLLDAVLAHRKLLAQTLTKLNQTPSLTSYIASGSNPKQDLLFYPFGGRVASVKFQQGTTAEMAERAAKRQVCRVPRSQLLTVAHLEAALKAYANRLSFHVFARKHQQALEEVWKAPATPSTAAPSMRVATPSVRVGTPSVGAATPSVGAPVPFV